MLDRTRRHRLRRPLLPLAAVVTALAAGCVADAGPGSNAEDDVPLESLAPDALHWAAPLADDAIHAGDPVDLTVYTQRRDVQVVHFEVDGQEVGACDANDPDQDCFDGDNWNWSLEFDAAGPHTIRAYFTGASGDTVAIERDVTALDEDNADVSGDPSGAGDPSDPGGDPNAPDPLSADQQIDEGTGQVTQGIASHRGYLDPNEPMGSASCHRRAANACNPPSEAGCLAWSVQSSRVMLAAPARIDGSTAELDRCVQDFGDSIRRYADLRYVSRAAVAAWLATTGNCGPRHRWHGNLIDGARCAAVVRHATGHRMSARDCRARAASNADFAVQIAAEYLARTRAQHHHDPVLMAAYIHHGAHRQRGDLNNWCVGSGASSGPFITHFIAAYNAYRTHENETQPGTLAAAAHDTHVRVGTVDDATGCSPGDARQPPERCAASATQFTRRAATWFWPECVPAWMAAHPDQVQQAYAAAGRTVPTHLEACAPPGLACPAGHPNCGRTFTPDMTPRSWPDGASNVGQHVIDLLRVVHANHQRIEVNTLLYAHIPPLVLWAHDHASAIGEGDAAKVLEDASDAWLHAILTFAPTVDPGTPARQGVNAPLGSNPLIDTWGIVNETVEDHHPMTAKDGTHLYLGGTGEWGGRLGSAYPGYLLHVFESAHRYAPDAELMINELNATGGNRTHMQHYADLVAWLLRHGAALDVVGLQAHDTLDPNGDADPTSAEIRDNLDLFAHVAYDDQGNLLRGLERGVREHRGPRIHLTELDVRTADAGGTSRDEQQRRHFYDLVAACVAQPHCTDITFWGVGDADSWADCLDFSHCFKDHNGAMDPAGANAACSHTPDHSMLFDERYCPRTTVPTVIDALLGAEYPSADAARVALPVCTSTATPPNCGCFPGMAGGTPMCCSAPAHPAAAWACM